MSGRIWARNNSDSKNDAVGSTFYFYLPLVSIEQDHNDHIIGLPAAIATTKRRNSITSENLRRTSITSAQKDHISLSECRVLLVDDILINRKVLLRMLKSIGVPHAVTAESGEKALRELAANQYDLVITDLQMPGMSGTELSIAINTEYGDSTSAQLSDNSPPIVVGLTADTGIDVVERCAASGMADILYKPLTLVEMKEYFETTIPRLEAGVWYADVYDAQKDRLLAQ
jgi:CheY-like chemotaxis protein